jgi:hypothetical protein
MSKNIILVYGVHNLQMSLRGPYVSAGALVKQVWRQLRKANPSCRRGDPISKHINGLGTNKKFVVCSDKFRN